MAIKDKATQMLDGFLLSEYESSPLLREYMLAFIAEFDLLFEQVEEVYLGRFLENAIGAQLDVIGIILQQERGIVLPQEYFGFVGGIGATKMADYADPTDGGLFKSESEVGYGITPLDDELYRRVLTVIANLTNSDTISKEVVYRCITILMGRVPPNLQLVTTSAKRVSLKLSETHSTSRERAIIQYMSSYFIPSGVSFSIDKT